MYEYAKEDKRRDLLSWIKDYETKFDEKHKDIDSDRKEFFEKVYEDSDNIRKYFFDHYLNNISNNLYAKSDKNSYQYKDFFDKEKFDLNNKYAKMFRNEKEKEIEKEERTKNKKWNKYENTKKENIKNNSPKKYEE